MFAWGGYGTEGIVMSSVSYNSHFKRAEFWHRTGSTFCGAQARDPVSSAPVPLPAAA